MWLPALLAIGFAPCAQEKPPPPDRSGEPVLRNILKATGAQRNVIALINFSERERSGEPFIPDRTTTLWYAAPNKFRVVNTSVWGDSALVVSDGKTMYYDPMDDRPALLRRASESIIESHNSLAIKGGSWSLLFYLLQGETIFEKLVASDGDIVGFEGKATKSVRFKSKELGTVTLYANGQGVITMIEYDNRPTREARYRTAPQWFPKPEDALDRENITFSRADFDSRTFRAEPPPGRSFTDRRKDTQR